MTHVFVILGRTHSYKDFVYKHCKHNPALKCTTIDTIVDGCTNVVMCNINDYNKLKTNDYRLHPVYIHTPEDQVLHAGIEYWRNNGRKFDLMCRVYIEESEAYSNNNIESIGALRIQTDNACDACYDFMTHIKATLAR